MTDRVDGRWTMASQPIADPSVMSTKAKLYIPRSIWTNITEEKANQSNITIIHGIIFHRGAELAHIFQKTINNSWSPSGGC